LDVWKRYQARRYRKRHALVEAERARQRELAANDAEDAVKKVTQGSAEAQQGLYGTGH
jgi:hypothetical protein